MLQAEAAVSAMPFVRKNISFAGIACGLSYALDMASENSPGHSLRTCLLGMKLGRRIGLKREELGALYYGLLFKDLGCNGTMAHALRFRDEAGGGAKLLLRNGPGGMSTRRIVSTVRAMYREDRTIRGLQELTTRCASMGLVRQRSSAQKRRLAVNRAHALGFGASTTEALAYVDARWDGKGYPEAEERMIPVLAQIVKLAQTLDQLYELYGHRETLETVYRRCRGWFDPGLVAASMLILHSEESWSDLQRTDLVKYVAEQEPMGWSGEATLSVDALCEVLGEMVDSRSRHMEGHSRHVATVSVQIGEAMGLQGGEIVTLRRAALLHNLGMLSVAPSVVNKKEPLTESESESIRRAPLETTRLLARVEGFEEVALVASSHHERLDGTGYPFGLSGGAICLLARIVAVANVTEALAASRSYRKQMSAEEIYDAVDALTPHALDADCVRALRSADVLAMVA